MHNELGEKCAGAAGRVLALVSFAALGLASSAVWAMSPCPPGSTGGKPALAWSVLSIGLVAASLSAYFVIRFGFRSASPWRRLGALFFAVGVWGAVAYIGVRGFIHYMYSCY